MFLKLPATKNSCLPLKGVVLKKGTFPSLCKIASWNPLKVCLQNLFALLYMDRKTCKSRTQDYLETVAVIPEVFLNLKYFTEFCPSVPSLPHSPHPSSPCLKNSGNYFMNVSTGNMSSHLEEKLMLLLVCAELVIECSGPVVGSWEGFACLQRVS